MLYSNGYYPMKPIPLEIKILYDAVLIKKGVALPAHFHCRKWIRYYLCFCLKYHHEPIKKKSLAPFIQKLKDKNQTEQQWKQLFDAVSMFYQIMFYQIKKTDQGKIHTLKDKKENISTKKTELKSINADWNPVHQSYIKNARYPNV